MVRSRSVLGQGEHGADIGLIGGNVVAAGDNCACTLCLQSGGIDPKPSVADDEWDFRRRD